MSTYINDKLLDIVEKSANFYDINREDPSITFIPNGGSKTAIIVNYKAQGYEVKDISSKYINDEGTSTILAYRRAKSWSSENEVNCVETFVISTGNMYIVAGINVECDISKIYKQYLQGINIEDKIVFNQDIASFEERDKLVTFQSKISENKFNKMKMIYNISKIIKSEDNKELAIIDKGKEVYIISPYEIMLPVNANKAFRYMKFDTFEFNNINTEYIKIADYLFSNCTVNKLSFKYFKGKLVSTSRMFEWLKVKDLDITDLDLTQVNKADFMFDNISYNGEIKVRLPNVCSAVYMFASSAIDRIEISDINKAYNIEGIARHCNAKELIFRNCKIDLETKIAEIFEYSIIDNLVFINCDFKADTMTKRKAEKLFSGSKIKKITIINSNIYDLINQLYSKAEYTIEPVLVDKQGREYTGISGYRLLTSRSIAE